MKQQIRDHRWLHLLAPAVAQGDDPWSWEPKGFGFTPVMQDTRPTVVVYGETDPNPVEYWTELAKVNWVNISPKNGWTSQQSSLVMGCSTWAQGDPKQLLRGDPLAFLPLSEPPTQPAPVSQFVSFGGVRYQYPKWSFWRVEPIIWRASQVHHHQPSISSGVVCPNNPPTLRDDFSLKRAWNWTQRWWEMESPWFRGDPSACHQRSSQRTTQLCIPASNRRGYGMLSPFFFWKSSRKTSWWTMVDNGWWLVGSDPP